MLERTTEIGPPIIHPSTCLISLPSAKKPLKTFAELIE